MEYYREQMMNGERYYSYHPGLYHNVVAFNITGILSEIKGAEVYCGCALFLSTKDQVVPDVAVVRNHDILMPAGIFGVPDLIVEVLVFASARFDRGYKKQLYQAHGVKEYWIADAKSKSIEVYLLGDEGKYRFDGVYFVPEDWELEPMSDEERSEVLYKFSTHLSDELMIDVREVFKNVK